MASKKVLADPAGRNTSAEGSHTALIALAVLQQDSDGEGCVERNPFTLSVFHYFHLQIDHRL
jgi:hypothetical protein